jgi:Na+/proline symporter
MYFEKAMGWHDEDIAEHATYTNFVAIPSIIVYVLALLEKRKKHYQNVMTWKQGFISGMIITAVVVILTPFSQMVTHELISPEYFENVSAYAVNQGEMTQDEANNYFNLKSYMLQSAVGALIMGALTSAIVAVFVRRKG